MTTKEQLRAEKNILFNQWQSMCKDNKRKYGSIDISQPIGDDERRDTAAANSIYSKITQLILEIRKL